MLGEAPRPAPDDALLELLRELERCGYDFVPPSPATHRRVLARKAPMSKRDLRDVLGWSLPFRRGDIAGNLFELLDAASVIDRAGGTLRSSIRVARLGGDLYVHSAFPTDGANAVFLGPDSYRFVNWLVTAFAAAPHGRVVDIGAGAGVGGITVARLHRAAEVLLTDVNQLALRYARINAAHAGVGVTFRQTSILDDVPADIGTVLANPPYMAASTQAYRAGGDMHGGQVSLDWARAALAKLNPGGQLLLYTGTAILNGGVDPLQTALRRLAQQHGASLAYQEIDPDVFGEELETESYADVERIAVVTATVGMPA